MEEAQEPTTVGCASSSSSPRDLQPAGHPADDVHQYGAYQPAYQSPEEQFHENPLLAIVAQMTCSVAAMVHRIALNSNSPTTASSGFLDQAAQEKPPVDCRGSQRDLNLLLILSQRFVGGDLVVSVASRFEPASRVD